ncbi:hypothetical protein ACHAQA_009318 [Verticillium albo-atrum]
MLRPATPLSVLLFAAFALLLLSVLSVPIITAIPLGSFAGVDYGVLGFCNRGDCSAIQIGYDLAGLSSNSNDFDLPEGTRNSLTAILIVHPVAALLTLILFILAAVAHLHSPSHSSRYLLVVFIFSFITFLVCLLAFLIDVLIFIPHLAWGSYIVLAATIMVGLSGLVSCAMRRTLISRKARKAKIAENAEMSGENYFNREAQSKAAISTAPQPSMPVLSGGNGGADNLPTFATFEDQKKDDQVSDERIPLTTRSPIERTPSNLTSDVGGPGDMNAYSSAPTSRAGSVPRPERDQCGNPIIAQQDAYGMRRGPSDGNRQFDRMNSRGRGGMPPGGFRGRGGYGGNGGRGGYGGPPMGGRGGYGPRGRGGYGPPPNARGGGGYGPSRGGYAAAGAMAGGAMMLGRSTPGYQNGPGPYERQQSPHNAYAGPFDEASTNYSANNSTNPSLPGNYEAYNPDRSSLPRAESPPPLPSNEPRPMVGQAVEMDAVSGSPAQAPQGYGSFGGLRDSDADIAGMVGLQQGISDSSNRRHDTYMSDGSKYSSDEQYMPPRQAWAQGQGRNSPGVPSPLGGSRPAELAGRNSPQQSTVSQSNYYEDIDPRFASSTPPENAQPPPMQPNPPPSETYDYPRQERGARARSPGAESDRSNFTSISQRSVNPRWNPPPPMPGYGGQPIPRRAPQPRQQDMLLNSNPDFQLPGARGPNPNRGPGGGMIPGSAYPQGPL